MVLEFEEPLAMLAVSVFAVAVLLPGGPPVGLQLVDFNHVLSVAPVQV